MAFPADRADGSDRVRPVAGDSRPAVIGAGNAPAGTVSAAVAAFSCRDHRTRVGEPQCDGGSVARRCTARRFPSGRVTGTAMNSEPLYLKRDVQVEPLIDQWYAWSYLIPPQTAAR